MKDILIIEDNEEMGTLLSDFLKYEGFETLLCEDAEKGLTALENEKFRLILLDVMLPGMNGFETCTRIRSRLNIPVLMMSARTDDSSKIAGYNTGADDYIEKPFSVPVLTAKIKSLLSRSSTPDSSSLITACGITIDTASRRVTQNGREITVTGKSYDILCYLIQHPGEVINKDTLFSQIWGNDCFSEPSTLNVHIRWLREKLEKDPKNPEIIKTVWKVGYIFGEETDEH
ncbi:MAG: response regulator transcription factor [Oscillospiraceae bacterium]|nr:response regulator transcription factor [Oscillospiraceae bacterium]